MIKMIRIKLTYSNKIMEFTSWKAFGLHTIKHFGWTLLKKGD